ncbi:Uncharacterised protein [Mycobacterium tuberculosis]|nr:Uncharacterised protein [Mycobacterium tuberculosis]
MALLSAAVPIWKRVHAEVDAGLGDDGPDQLRSLLGAIRYRPKEKPVP